MKLYDGDSQIMVDAKSIEVDKNGDGLVLDCTIMGAYDMLIYLDAYELANVFGILGKGVIGRLVKMLIKGRKAEPRPEPESTFHW